MSSQTDGFKLEKTSFASHAEEVLHMRNANRPIAQSAEYLAWRYQGLAGTQEPAIFWLRGKDGRAAGMASLIFRPYWLDNVKQDVAVLGDISLDSNLRGRGLGAVLLKFMTDHIREIEPDRLALVIPNAAAQRSLSSIGWVTPGRLIPHVLLLNAEHMLRRRVGGVGALAKGLAWPARQIVSALLRKARKPGYSLQLKTSLDDSFTGLWRDCDKTGAVIGDRDAETLAWRYANHPHIAFSFAKLLFGQTLAGYLVYSFSREDRECVIYDLVMRRPEESSCMLAMFAMEVSKDPEIGNIRLLLNDKHPYRANLRKLGFISREASGVFQVNGEKAREGKGSAQWILTGGDKDI
ncbi:MAG TPA: GNAT family N-acetyltransferase [Burkholderiales bacterium]|nr:GNAT family N-acetyltransferase [Burkholderiales bacterium]